MDRLTYEAYRTDPAIRAQLDADVRRMRSEAWRDFVFMPVVDALRSTIATARAWMGARPRPRAIGYAAETI